MYNALVTILIIWHMSALISIGLKHDIHVLTRKGMQQQAITDQCCADSIAFSRGSRCQLCPRQVDTISRQPMAQQRELLFVSMIWGDPRKCARVMAERVQNVCGVGASRHAIRQTCGWWVPGAQVYLFWGSLQTTVEWACSGHWASGIWLCHNDSTAPLGMSRLSSTDLSMQEW